MNMTKGGGKKTRQEEHNSLSTAAVEHKDMPRKYSSSFEFSFPLVAVVYIKTSSST